MEDSAGYHGSSPRETPEEWGGVGTVYGDPGEQRVLFAALDSFYKYSNVAHYNTTHLRRQSFYALPQSHWQLLAAPPFSYLDTLNVVDDAIDQNAVLAMAILKSGLQSFGFSAEAKDTDLWCGTATTSDLEKARSTLRQFYRDWSLEGEPERAACYGPIIEDLLTEYYLLKPPSMNVLIPGAGLGRLVFELCKMGFNVEGNEISYHQLLASSYILNHCPSENHHTIYPWIHGFSNHISRSQHLQPVLIPDIHPGKELQDAAPLRAYPVASDRDSTLPGEMSMSASDFLSLYGDAAHKSTYDAVATVFFLDTAPNPIRYIETINNCLRPGGIWTNLGPLLWHFENNPPGSHGIGVDEASDASTTSEKPAADEQSMGIADPGSVELTDDEIVALVEHFGFKIEKRESRISAGYIQDPKSMLQSTYQVSHWVARKL